MEIDTIGVRGRIESFLNPRRNQSFFMPMLRDLQFVRAENVNEFGYATLVLP